MSAKKQAVHKNGFKTRIADLEREIRKKKKEQEKLERQEKTARALWTKGYHVFQKAAQQLSELKVHKTQKEARLKQKIREWPAQTIKLTQVRDEIRVKLKAVGYELVEFGTKLTRLREQEISDTKTTDDIVTQVFSLNEMVVRAASDREDCLKRHVFPRLFDEGGNLRSQLSFTSADGLKRVVAMVNTMTIVRGDLAAEAKTEIEKFFARFQEATQMDESVTPLYELTRQLLVEKTDFKVGPDLYRFLSMELDGDVFPELVKAQSLLRLSIRSEKTNSYIRLYRRNSLADNWEVVPQS